MYKKVLRVLCAMMALVLVMTGIDLSFVSFAHAEGSAGGSNVSATPDELLSMGEWLYWVENGLAIVAGYTNPDEASLTIPYHLGGYPVAGIGHRAFASNNGLRSITIHTNVTSIANDAFFGLDGITIAAYNGAYALSFALSNGVRTRNLSTAAEFTHNAIDLTGLSSRTYQGLSENTVSFIEKEATFLQIGQVLYFPAQAAYPTGLAKKVASIDNRNGKLYVSFSQPDWGEVFIRVQGEDELYVDWSNAQWGYGFEPEGDTSSSGAGSITGFSVDSPKLKVNLMVGDFKVGGSLQVSLKKPTVKWDIGHGWWGIIPVPDPRLVEIILPFETNAKFTASYKFDNGTDGRWFPRKQIFGEKCSLATVPVASVGGAINGYLTLDILVEISGELEVTYKILTTFDIAWRNGKFTIDKEKNETTDYKLSGTVKIGPELKVYFVLGWAGFAIRIAEASIGLYIIGEGSITETNIIKGTADYVRCSDISVRVDLEIAAKAGIVKVSGIGFSLYEGKSKSWTLCTLGNLHWEYGALVHNALWNYKVGFCSLKNRKVVIRAGNGNKPFEMTANVNDILRSPISSPPTRKGYKFTGWHVNTKDSGLPGSNYSVTFGMTRMPYCGQTGTLYIDADWKDMNPVTKIELDKSSIIGFSNVGTTEKINITKITPSDANNKAVKWSSSNTSVATVDQKGNVTLKNAGTAVITCTSDGNPSVKATCNVTVKQSVTGIQLSPNNVFRYSDNMDGFQITPTALPADAADKTVTWSSDNTSVATVSDTGFVTLKGLGTATITCQSVQNPKVTGKCTIAVRQAVTGITLNKENEFRTNADMSPIKLVATVAPADAWNKTLTWTSSNPAVATVSEDGAVTPKGIGITTITCASVSNPNVTDTFELQIVQAVTEIKLNTYSVTRYSDETEPVQLTPEILPADAYNKNVTWTTSNPSVVTVDENGLVTIVSTQNQKEAHATVTCQSVSNPEVTAECKFAILQAVTGIELDKTSISTSIDEVNPAWLYATISPSYAYNKAVTWTSSDPTVAAVTNDGIVVFKGIGQAIITCASVSTPSITATCTVNVTEAVTGLRLSERSIVRYSNQTDGVQLIATLDAAPVADREVTWTTSNASIATVTASGIVSTHGVGNAVITCTSNSNPDVSAECLVIVRQSVTSITLNETAINRDSDHLGTVQLTASVLPSTAANMDLKWESDTPAVAAVDDTGLVVLLGPGTATITCRSISDPEINATCSVTILQALDSIRLNITELTRYTSDTSPVQLIAYAYPSYAPNKDVTWESSNTNVVTVSASGAVTVVGTGTATITCQSISKPELTAECSVNIRQAVTTVTLNKKTLTLYSDRTAAYNLTATVAPDDAENKALIWTTSNPSVANVSDNGQVIVAGAGKAIITCRAASNPNAYATCTITVKQAVQSIVLNEAEIICYSDDTTEYQLTASVQPAHADNKAVTWESSNTDVVTVAADGSLTIVGVGSAIITCTSKVKTSVKAQCNVTVMQPMTAINLSQSAIELYSDDENGVQLTATIIPNGTDDTDVIWQSDNEYVAIVSDTGLVQAVAKGTAHITCNSARNPETVFAICTVDVKQKVEAIEIEGNTSSLLPNESVQLTAKRYPEIADNKNVTWSSDNPSVATVNETGLVTAIHYGSAVITATTTDGSNLSAAYAVNVEHELVLETVIENDALYAQGNHYATIATVRLSNGSARRMAEAGYDVSWSLSKPDNSDDVAIDVLGTSIIDRGDEYETTYALLGGSYVDAVGSRTYTISCTAGAYTASVDVTINVNNTQIPESIVLAPSTYTKKAGEVISISGTPSSADSNTVPADLEIIGISGDEYFTNNSTITMRDNGCEIVFNESGIYSATIQYAVKNIAYDVNVSFYIQDETGMIHIRTESLALDESYLVLVQGTARKLNYTATPLDAYDTSVTWSSSDESVVQVDQNGVVTAVRPGSASIACTANDGHGATAICAVTVESFLQLDDAALEYIIYTGGDNHADLGIVNVTIDSERRLMDAGLNVTWSLEKVSGSACDIGIEEFRAQAEQGVTVSGNRIKLLRIHEAGTDQYRLTCKAGVYTESCLINIQVIQYNLPSTITLNQTAYTGTINETITIDTTYSPAVLPDSTSIKISGGNAFENALSDQYDFTEPEKVIFKAPGTYAADVIFSGDNYSYTCPITIEVSDESGNVPVNITDLRINPEYLNLLVGEQATLSCEAEPLHASFSQVTWTSSDTGVATISSSGKVTAISAGIAFISATVPESDFTGGCMIVVEDGLTLQQDGIERTVFVDGITRTQLDIVQLTASSSQRLGNAPEWSLARVSGNNLTLKLKEYNTSDEHGNLIYGCSILLYSMSREGDTEYELTCTAGNETVTIPVTVHAIDRGQDLPSGLSFAQNTFTASVNELILIIPDIVCLPSGTKLPDGMRVTLEGNALFNNSVNTDDYYVSQNMSTLSFNRAGLFEANYIYSYSNMRYVIPVTFRIMDGTGTVPVLATSVSLNSRSLWLTEGETAKLSAVFTPADTDNKAVSWTSTDTSVVTVDNNGNVRAVGKGQAEIICQPDETYLSGMVCSVWVEDFLSWNIGEDHITLYKQGEQVNEVFSAALSEGTIARLSKAGISPEWSLTRVSGTHSEIITTTSESGDSVIVTSASLISNGSDVYCLNCTAGEYTKSVSFTVEVIDSDGIAESISLAQKKVNTSVGHTITLDFTPVCYPSNSHMPQNDQMWSLYAGIGDGFHEAVDYSVYEENGDFVTIRFTKPGRYLFSRQFFLNNLHYEQVCEIVVGESTEPLSLLKASATDAVVYMGGTAGVISSVHVSDTLMLDVFSGNIDWTLSHISGDSMDAILRKAGNGAELLTVATNHAGEDTWRITCVFGDYSEYVDIHVSVREPRSVAPERVELSLNRISGMMGNWLSMPIAVSCMPVGSALPETGDDFWSFTPTGLAADVCDWEIEDGILRVRFRWPGYYAGNLSYEAGNFKYSMPVYMVITDEEGVLTAPDMEIYLLNMPASIYTDGQANTVIGIAELSHGIGSYYSGEAAAYMNEHEGVWSIEITSGNAVSLAIESIDNHCAQIIVNEISRPGTIQYKVTCTADSITYEKTGSLTVLEASADHPDPVLQHSVYYAVTGEILVIPTILYDRGTGSILQGTTKWVPDALLTAIGYEYIEQSDSLQMTFYKEGTFSTTLLVTIGNLNYEIPFTIVVSQTPVTYTNILKLPAALTAIDDYAFEGIAADVVDLRNTRITSIGAGAFSQCTELAIIYIPSTVNEIASNAFYGCPNLMIVCEQGSSADSYASQHDIPVRYE